MRKAERSESDISKNQLMKPEKIKSRIYTIRSVQVMIDRDLAELYEVNTKTLNQAVKRNLERFPEAFRFQLNDTEKFELVTNCDRFEKLKHSSVNPYAFTEQGVAMLSAVLRSETAIKMSIQIISAFVAMRRFITANAMIFQRLDTLEIKQIDTDKKINKQYPLVVLKEFKNSHDRFLIIDDSIIYHFGASLKDLGSKWFAFSKMDIETVEMLNKLENFGKVKKI